MVLHVDIELPSPFYVLFAPANELSSGFVEANTFSFYRELFTSWKGHLAYDHLKDGFLKFQSEIMLFQALAFYVRDKCMGKGGRERVESLISQIPKSAPPRKDQLANWRNHIRGEIVPNQQLVDQGRAKFLMGKDPGFTIEDVISAARQSLLELDRRRAAERRHIKDLIRYRTLGSIGITKPSSP